MFPLNLQRNIVQLDRQISLLENECKNMEIEKRKKFQKPETSYSPCSKSSNVRMKAPTVRVTVKKTESSKRSKRPTPPASSRLQSTGSLPSHCGRTWCESDEPPVGRKGKPCALNSKPPVHSYQAVASPNCNSRLQSKCRKCVCHNEISVSDLGNDESFDVTKKDHVLLFPNSGGTIEVTVTQKTNNGKENSPISHKSPLRKSVNSEKDLEKDLDGCKCQIKGRKWSDILCVDPLKKRKSNSGNCVKNNILADETKIVYQPLNFKNNRKPDEDAIYENHNNSGTTIQEETFEVPVKLPSQLAKTKRQSEINSNKFEKEIQCSLDSLGSSTKELEDPVKIFQLLVNQFQQMSGKDLTKSSGTDSITKVEDSLKEKSDADKNNITSTATAQNNVSYLNTVKHHCENLIKEKSLLTEDLAAKDNVISAMKKREEEYLSLIASLKTSLEKTKEHAQEGMEAVKQMNVIKNKLLEQMKVSEALKKKLIKLHEDSTEYNVENSKLKTEIKILRLEAQKHAIMMAGKEAEINRYREEIQNFQRQIEEHLTSLKSNAQVVDIEKMIEAIMQQSQIFAQTDLDSLTGKDEKEDKDSSRLQNVLMHSSPTSTKTSVVNSSWKQISSIHEHDQSKAHSEVIYLNDDKNEKNFFDIFGENPPGKTKEPSIERLLEKGEVKNSSSFTSCTSLREDHNTTKSTSRDSLISKDTLVSLGEAAEEQLRNGGGGSLDKAQSNIDELLKNMKLKFSKEIFETTLPSCTTEDYLDISQISSISPL